MDIKIIILIILLLFVLNIPIYKYKFELNDDGIVKINKILSNNDLIEIQKLLKDNNIKKIKSYISNNKNINDKIKKFIGEDYLFHDYIFYIKKSKIHTCHRDYNGTFFNKNVKNKSYTIIFYLKNMGSGLDFISGSHKNMYNNAINFFDITQGISCEIGDALLFDSNIVHSGAFNDDNDNPRIQMKISHKDDIKHFDYYQKYNKVLEKDNKSNIYLQRIQKNLSCQFPIISDLTSYDKKNNIKNNTFGKNYFEELIGYLFYGDKQFYDLKELFINKL